MTIKLPFSDFFSGEPSQYNSYENVIIDIRKVIICLIFLLIVFGFNTLNLSQKNFYVETEKNNQITKKKNKNLFEIKQKFSDNLKTPYKKYDYVIENNDSINSIFKKFNIDNKEVRMIIEELKEKKLTNIYPGRTISIILKKDKKNLNNNIVDINYPLSNTLSVRIIKNKDSFNIKKKILKLKRKEVIVSNTISNNLYSAAIKSGVEPNVIIEFARIYGFEVDFQRDLRKGDGFQIYYEKFLDDKNNVRDTGKIIYASMNVNGKEINLYNFKFKNDSGFYDINGRSIVKSLMKTPINGARLSSPFGMRKHPILGFNKLHTGTDFAAPMGTPVMASGSGKVIRARWCGGGGNCVKIRHNSIYETVYAHLQGFARGIKEGKMVTQGQTIGYVGSTGMSTGPHLHYEVHVNKKKVNSRTLKLPSGKILKGEERKEFEIHRIKIDLQLNELRSNN